MGELNQAVEVAKNVYWVGVIDWELRDFHGYTTPRGSTYNAYLVLDDKIALIDAVKAPFKDELMQRIASVVDPSKIDVIISNHSEMDHTGCLADVMDLVKPERVLASAKGSETLVRHFPNLAGRIEAVQDGQMLSLGNNDLTFIETRMLHWPDSMMTYLPAEGLLFSQDGFGMHLASRERFADELSTETIEHEAAKYYANILLPLGPRVGKALRALEALDLKLIAPDHGPVFRRDTGRIIELYSRWMTQAPTRKAVLVYDTMWGSTAKMARTIGEGLTSGGISVRLMPLSENDRSAVVTEVLDAGALLVGSPTINGNMFPTVADVLTYLKGLNPKNLIGAAFGSYGWAPRGVSLVGEALERMKVELVDEGLAVNYVPDPDDLAKCRALGERTAERLTEKCASQ